MADLESHGFRFGPFEVDLERRRLLRDGEPVPVAPKAFDLLLLLVQHRSRLLQKEELMERLWPGTFVDEANLSQQVFMLRKALGEQPNGKPYIETVPRRGYVFAADIQEIGGSEDRHDRSPARRRILVIAGFVTVLVLVLASFLYVRTRDKPVRVRSPAQPKTLAVLPFRGLGSAPVDEYLALGMADAVITRLTTIRGIVVRPTSAVLKYHQTDDPLGAGRKLQVDVLLDGRFQRDGDRIRVSVQLINVADGSSIWGDRFDQTYADVFALQDVIAERVAGALAQNLTEQERVRLRKRYTENIQTYHLYLRGRYFWERRTAEALQKSIDYYQQAIATDPSYALAYAGLADSYNVLGALGDLPPGEAFPKAKAAAAKALEIDPELWQAGIAHAFATYLYDRDWETAERGFKRALANAPNYGPGHQWYAVCLVSRGRSDEATAEIRRALEVDPLSLVINAVAGWVHYLNRDFDAAIEAGKRTVEMDPSFPLSHSYLGRTYAVQGRYQDAEIELRKAMSRGGPGVSQSVGMLGFVLARTGRPEQARDIVRNLSLPEKQKYATSYVEALVLIGLGENAQALTMLERSVDHHYPWAIHYNVEPALDPLRDEPRFKALLQRLGLPELDLSRKSSAIAAVIFVLFHRPPRPAQTSVFPVDLPPLAAETDFAGRDFAISPDGRRLVLSLNRGGTRQLYLRSFDRPDLHSLPSTKNAIVPFFSPDERWIGFASGGKLRKVPVSGGSPVTICDAPRFRGGTWGTDGTVVFAPRSSRRRPVQDLSRWRFAASFNTTGHYSC